ncbi:MAG TPA: hypothetical protein VL181_04180 [Holophagaceae bacterium]|nr:hypothetical protein [Holophagaceae bacterium]
MRRTALIPLLALAFAAPALQAQDFHPSFTIDLIAPTGDFNSKTYPASPYSNTPGSPQTEQYDIGLGINFGLSFPTSRVTAFRLNFAGTTNSGKNTAPGYADLDLRHSSFNVGGDLQIFPDGGAWRHHGFYLLGGLSADFEKFEYSDNGFDNYYSDTTSINKSRMGGEIGFGNTFGGDAGPRFTLEVTYHTSLTAHDVSAGDPPATSYVRAGFGWVF